MRLREHFGRLMKRTQISCVLRRSWLRGCGSLVFVTSLKEQLGPPVGRAQISCVLGGIWLRGCESLVFVTYLNLSVSALYSTLIHSTPLHSTPLLCRYSEQGNTRKQVLLSVVIRKKLTFVMSLPRREGPLSRNVLPGNVSDASTQRRV